MSAFAEWQSRYAEQGIATFPVRDKQPMVKGYLKIGSRVSGQLALKFPAEEAFGLACRLNRITVLDVDAADERLLADALDEFGPTPFVVRSGSGNYQAWYRHAGERRRVRPNPDRPIDILGDGFVVCPPSLGSKGRYEIIQGGLDDLRTLPKMRHPVQAAPMSGGEGQIGKGKRNDSLWRWCMAHAKQCNTIGELTEAAMQANVAMCKEPLPIAEVVQIVTSAWAKEMNGTNWFGSDSRIILGHDEFDKLESDQGALLLYFKLKRHHWGREFRVANAMHRKMGWTLRKFQAARQRLVEIGVIEMVRPASRSGGPAVYKFQK